MLKTIRIILAACVVSACTVGKTPLGEDDGSGGNGNGPAGGLISIAALKAMYVNRPVTIKDEFSIRGRVVSSDLWGNFYKTLCVEDESGGIAIRIDKEDYFRIFELGDIVTVYCNSLTLATYAGAHQLGVQDPDNPAGVTHIPGEYLPSCVSVKPALEPLTAGNAAIPGLQPSDIGRYVTIRDVQFEEWEEFMTWCDEGIDTNRTLIDKEGNRLVVRTSRHAEFAGDPLPSGSGIIRGVVGYYNGMYQLTVWNSFSAGMEQERF